MEPDACRAASRVHPSVEKALHLLKDRTDAFSFKSLALATGFGSYAQCHRVVSHSLHRSPRQLRAGLPS
ncbi:MAG: hypothetical protein RL648_1784 [Verrucomicrobiota bacterium]|jgi:transcriptional regulator GlxA family with amidase domain